MSKNHLNPIALQGYRTLLANSLIAMERPDAIIQGKLYKHSR
jgi:hypothetical protein